MQAITTKYLSATNHRGARIKAKAFGGSITRPYDYQYSVLDNHLIAAQSLMSKLNWHTSLKVIASGALHSGDGYAFVMGNK